MEITAEAVSYEAIKPWRDLFRQEMNCQIIGDTIDSRKDWSQPYFLKIGSDTVG